MPRVRSDVANTIALDFTCFTTRQANRMASISSAVGGRFAFASVRSLRISGGVLDYSVLAIADGIDINLKGIFKIMIE